MSLPRFAASIALLFRSLNKRVILFLLLSIIIIFSLLDIRSFSNNSTLASDSPTQFGISLDDSRGGRSSGPAKLRPVSCDPNAYPLDSSMRLALTPPDVPEGAREAWRTENHKQFVGLCKCLQKGQCRPNQSRVVLISANPFQDFYQNSGIGTNGGESIWARSVAMALEKLGYTFFYEENITDLVAYNALLPSLITNIIVDSSQAFECAKNPVCIKSASHPTGLPIWKLLSFYFWIEPEHPLGARWVLSPEDYKSRGKGANTYLGYSVEPSCRHTSFVPHARRPIGRAYTMTKRLSYFAPEVPERAWPVEFYTAAVKELRKSTGLKFTAGAHNDTDFAEQWGLTMPRLPVEEGVFENIGLMGQVRFMQEVAKSRVLVGIGRPAISPTPYQALCLGVPFINPILQWDPTDTQNRKKWETQHNGLKTLDPPYVYNVFKEDRAGFIKALKDALEHPVDRYIPNRMKQERVEARLRDILETDWREEAEQVLDERRRSGSGELFTI